MAKSRKRIERAKRLRTAGANKFASLNPARIDGHDDPSHGPGAVKDGKQLPPMRDGWFMRGGERVVQKMHEDNGEFKGMEAILVERGRIEKGKVKGVCKAKEGEEKPHENCCCKHVLAAEPDFQSEPTALEDLITKLGHLTKMLPKCHPELNPIEQFWAAVKEYLRRVCGYSFVALKGNIPTALREAVPLDQVQRYFRRAWRFQELYAFEVEKGVVLPAAVREYTMKKYKRHRTVPATLLADVTSD